MVRARRIEERCQTALDGNGISADAAIRGIHSVTMTVRSLEMTHQLAAELLNYRS